MKNTLLSILSVMCLWLGSCESVLDLEPKNGITFDHFFRNENDLEVLMRQMHADMRMFFAGVSYQEHMGIKSDRVYNNVTFEKIRSLEANYLTSRLTQSGWKKYYNVISLTDLFSDNYTKAKGVSESRLDFYKGQASFVRAVCYFTLARTWGDAVITRNSRYTEPYAKRPASEVLDTAIVSAERAFRLLPAHEELRDVNNKKLVSKQYGSKGNAAGLLAHMYAWKGSLFNDAAALQKSIDWASHLIEPQYREEVGSYELAQNAEEVCTKVMGRNSSEGVFEIEINYTDVSIYGHFFPGSYFIGYPVWKNEGPGDITKKTYGLTRETVNGMYEQQDQRRTSYFYQQDESGLNAADQAYLYKWREGVFEAVGQEIYFDGMNCNRVVIRLADLYLLRAECEAKLGQNSLAIADLNKIRGLRGATAWPGTPADTADDLLWDIFRERERELLCEGYRYYDAVRNGYYGKTNKHKGVLSDAFDNLTADEVKSGALYLPVPETAFKDNGLMIQNTYWMSKMK